MVHSHSRKLGPVVLCALLGSATARAEGLDAASEQICGREHPADVRRVMIARNPNAAMRTVDTESGRRFNRGLIIRDFIRLRDERSAAVPETVRGIDVARLRSDGDRGLVTEDVCAVVHFMSEYYGALQALTDATPLYLRGDGAGEAAGAAAEVRVAREGAAIPEPVIVRDVPIEPEAPSVPAPPRPRPHGLLRIALSEPAHAPALEPTPSDVVVLEPAPTVEPEHEVASVAAPSVQRTSTPLPAPVDSDAAVRRIAQGVIRDIEQQLGVPRYLSFREARIEASRIPDEDLARRREASLRASERIVALLETLQRIPALREAVQASLGVEGRARLEESILVTFRSVPDIERARALGLWVALESAAAESR